MPPYTSYDLKRIADALGVDAEVIQSSAGSLDRARIFVEFYGKAMPKSPTETRRDLLKIASGARRLMAKLDSLCAAPADPGGQSGRGGGARAVRSPGDLREAIVAAEKNVTSLLKHLGVADWREAMDGPDHEIKDSLSLADGTDLDAIDELTARIGELSPLLAAARSAMPDMGHIEIPAELRAAVEELECVASSAADEVIQIGEVVVPRGHHGDLQVLGWIEDMGRLYQEVTGLRPTHWVNRDASASRFIRLLQAAGGPIGLDYTPQAWRRRVRDYLKQLPQPV